MLWIQPITKNAEQKPPFSPTLIHIDSYFLAIVSMRGHVETRLKACKVGILECMALLARSQSGERLQGTFQISSESSQVQRQHKTPNFRK